MTETSCIQPDYADKTPPYPVFLNLVGKKCLIYGLGKVGTRKLDGILPSRPASVLALDVLPLASLPENTVKLLVPPVRYECRKWRVEDLAGCFLVFACTADAKANKELAETCSKKNILCNCATAPDEGNFIVPARARSGPLLAAISSSGASPLLSARLRDELDDWLKTNARLAAFLGLLRKEILMVSDDSDLNRELFSRLLNSPLPALLKQHDYMLCQEWLLSNMPILKPAQIERVFILLKNDVR